MCVNDKTQNVVIFKEQKNSLLGPQKVEGNSSEEVQFVLNLPHY